MVSRRCAKLSLLGWASLWGRPLIVVAGMLVGATLALAEVTIADPGTRVVDNARLLDATTAEQLEGWLKQLETQTTAQVKLLTVGSLDGEDIFQFSQRHYVLWKLGQKGKNNGALIVVAPAERKLRIHTGYGLEGALPDSWCGTLSRQIVKNYFQRGAFAEGSRELVIAVVQRVAAEYGKTIANAPRARLAPAPQAGSGVNAIVLVVVVLLLLLLWWQASRRGWIIDDRSLGGGYWGGPSGGWGGSSGGWGGSSGGWGGGGSFGGGSFGGGGDSGGGGGGASW